jgi:hypothetical protein
MDLQQCMSALATLRAVNLPSTVLLLPAALGAVNSPVGQEACADNFIPPADTAVETRPLALVAREAHVSPFSMAAEIPL